MLYWHHLLDIDNENEIVTYLIAAANSLQKAGADFGVIAANTPHMYFDRIQDEASLPLLSIVKATAEAALSKGYERVGLLGTMFTMGKAFYPSVFSTYNIDVVVPNQEDQEFIHKVLFEEVSYGKYLQPSKERLVEISKKLERDEQVEALILGCTELPLFLDNSSVCMPVLDTVAIHVQAAMQLALA
jgi:aspartate racemase